MNPDTPSAELDLAIPNMTTPDAERAVAASLGKLPGIHQVRLLERGAFIRYNPQGISHEEICGVLRRAGFRASTFQDSETGETGKSSQ